MHGLLKVFSNRTSDLGVIVKSLGTKWICEETAIKPYPACRLTHGAIDLATSLRKSQGKRSVRSLELEISALSNNIVGIRVPTKVHPQNNVDAQFSAYFQTAATWLDGSESGWGVYDRLLDSNVSELLDKISIKSNSKLSDLQTRLTVTYDDGATQSEFCEAPLGEASHPISAEDVRKKYISLAVPIFGQDHAEKIEAAIQGLEIAKVSEIMALLA
jgi:2-methylcitrate dehydratase PrpD